MLPGAWVVVVMQQGRGQRVAVVVGQWESIECSSKVGAEINVACLHGGN